MKTMYKQLVLIEAEESYSPLDIWRKAHGIRVDQISEFQWEAWTMNAPSRRGSTKEEACYALALFIGIPSWLSE